MTGSSTLADILCTDEEQISDFKPCILILSLIVRKKNICYCEGLAILFWREWLPEWRRYCGNNLLPITGCNILLGQLTTTWIWDRVHTTLVAYNAWCTLCSVYKKCLPRSDFLHLPILNLSPPFYLVSSLPPPPPHTQPIAYVLMALWLLLLISLLATTVRLVKQARSASLSTQFCSANCT